MRRNVILPLAAAVVLAVSCGVDAGDRAGGAGGPSAGSAGEVLEPAQEPLDGPTVLARTRASMALVETTFGSGSAVLLEDGYLVTNAHVVDPFDRVALTFEDDEPLEDVPVVAVDLAADLALLGPIETDRAALELVDSTDLAAGADVYLVGYPGDQRDQEVTLSRGVLSRRRAAEGWDLDFLVTDATIAGGQSGGALVDELGRVVGISGYEDEADFAYALDGGDARASLDQLVEGDGSRWAPVPREVTDTTWSGELAPGSEPAAFYLPATEDDRAIELSVTGPAIEVVVGDPGNSTLPWGASEQALEWEHDWWLLDDAEALEQTGDTYRFDLTGGLDAVVSVATVEGGAIDLRSSAPLERTSTWVDGGVLEVGDREAGSLNYLDDSHVFDLELAAGQEVEIAARAAVGDVAWEIAHEDATEDDDWTFVDDGGGGLFDLDAVDTFTAPTDGWYVLYVYAADGMSTDYELRIT